MKKQPKWQDPIQDSGYYYWAMRARRLNGPYRISQIGGEIYTFKKPNGRLTEIIISPHGLIVQDMEFYLECD